MRAYLAGPMSGYPEFNVPAFREVAARLRASGWEIVSPVEIDHGLNGSQDGPPQHYLKTDIRALLDCEAIILLRGWEQSVGARCEVAIAITLGLPTYDAETQQRLSCEVDIREGYRPLRHPQPASPTTPEESQCPTS